MNDESSSEDDVQIYDPSGVLSEESKDQMSFVEYQEHLKEHEKARETLK